MAKGREMADNWFYADVQNQQQGPVDKAWLGAAYRSGKIAAVTLVWREGLTGWVPLSQVASELHLVIVGGPPQLPRAAAQSGSRVVKPASSSTWVIVVVVVLFCFLAVIGILAAIAVPAYQDYVMRSKVSMALVQGDHLKVSVAEFFDTEKRCPHNGEGGIDSAATYATPVIASINVGALEKSGECAIQITFKNIGARDTEDKKLLLAMNAQGKWRSSSDLPTRFLPSSMRNVAQ
jgi:type IV pilus assembly protein PilA